MLNLLIRCVVVLHRFSVQRIIIRLCQRLHLDNVRLIQQAIVKVRVRFIEPERNVTSCCNLSLDTAQR